MTKVCGTPSSTLREVKDHDKLPRQVAEHGQGL